MDAEKSEMGGVKWMQQKDEPFCPVWQTLTKPQRDKATEGGIKENFLFLAGQCAALPKEWSSKIRKQAEEFEKNSLPRSTCKANRKG